MSPAPFIYTSKTIHQFVRSCFLPESQSGKEQTVEFDFIVAGELLRSRLGEHVSERGVSPEGVITVEYVERLPAPQPSDCLLHDDWVSAVNAREKWLVPKS